MTSVSTGIDTTGMAEVVEHEMERWSVPGVALGLLRDGAMETFAFGVASIDTGFPVRPDTLFQIGSITKVFTTTLIMQLVDEGRIDLDAPVTSYLPSFALGDAAVQEAITMRRLLSHQAGFYGDNFKDFGPGDDALAIAIAEFPSLRQLTPPGEL